MSKTTFRKHVKVIDYMLHRKFPDAEFEVNLRKVGIEAPGGYRDWDRWIEIGYFGDDKGCPERKEIEYYLKRYQNDKDRHGNIYARTFWVNSKGRAQLALIRKKFRDGYSSIVERYDPPEKGGPYKMERFELQEYRLINRDDKPYNTYKDDDD